jgi:cytochrome b561
MLGVLLAHVGAALKHHFIQRDDVLTRMLPFLKKKS